MNINKVRREFPILSGKKLVYFDNAATSLKPKSVINEIKKYYAEIGGSVHRAVHAPGEEATLRFEETRKKTANLINAKQPEIVFTKNTTESINTVMRSLADSNFFSRGDEIVLSQMEHHSNLVPWQWLAKKKKLKLKYILIKKNFELDLGDADKKISKKTKLVSLAHASNALGTKNPVKKIGKIAHEKGALFCVDAAQSAPHQKIDAKKIGADFLAFSAHKMLGPTGLGILFGKEELLQNMEPFQFGGSMIDNVSFEKALWSKAPEKFEAGTPPIAQAIAFSKAIDFLGKIGFDEIGAHEKMLSKKMLKRFGEEKKLELYSTKKIGKIEPIFLFKPIGLDPHDFALSLGDEAKIAIRSGMHCAEPLVSSINPSGLCRASLYFYNTEQEIDTFFDMATGMLKFL